MNNEPEPNGSPSEQKQTKALRKKRQREEKKRQQEEAAKKKQRQQQLKKVSVWGIIAAVIIAGGLGIWRLSQSSSSQDNSQESLLKVVGTDHTKGATDAPVTLIEYLDFECEACGAYYPLVKQLTEEYQDQVTFVARYFPLPSHKNAMPAALAVEAAGKQGKFWEMHDVLFENQKAWGERASADSTIFEEYAQQLGLDMEQFRQDVESDEVKNRVERDRNAGTRLGVNSTPTFFLNGEKIANNPKSYEEFKTLIEAAISQAPVTEGGSDSERVAGTPVHEHADFKVYLNSQEYDFTQEKYQSTDTNELDPDTHLHDGNGEIIHKHKSGITLGYFFETIGMAFTDSCLTLDTGEEFCSDDNATLKFLVNGQSNDQFGAYEFRDEDQILISYGNEGEAVIQEQISSVSDQACIYSETCPERGTPPTENCVGGLGTTCD